MGKNHVCAKSIIALFLGSAPAVRAREIIDGDDRAAKELCDFLKETCTTPLPEHAIQNLMNELEGLKYGGAKSWKRHSTKFNSLFAQLAFAGIYISKSDKMLYLIRSQA